MGNPFVHVELATDDVAGARKFYKGLFDWKLEDMKMQDGMVYTTIGVGKGTGGGMMKKPMPGPTMWLTYVQVDDVKKSIAKARKLGAAILTDYMEVPGMGALGVFTDPTGAMLGVWEFAKQPAPRKKAASAAKKGGAKKGGGKKAGGKKAGGKKR